MSKPEKYIIVIEKDFGEYVPRGWWETGSNVIHPYEYEWMRLSSEKNRHIPLREVRWFSLSVESHERSGSGE